MTENDHHRVCARCYEDVVVPAGPSTSTRMRGRSTLCCCCGRLTRDVCGAPPGASYLACEGTHLVGQDAVQRNIDESPMMLAYDSAANVTTTIGMRRFGQPELLFSMVPQQAPEIATTIAVWLSRGWRLPFDEPIKTLGVGTGPLVIRRIPRTPTVRPPASLAQVFLCDTEARLPGEPGFVAVDEQRFDRPAQSGT